MGEKRFPRDHPLLLVDAPTPPPVTVDPARDLEAAFNQRPDYQAARLGITVDRANESSARNQLLPQLNLVASYGYNGLDKNFAASRHLVGTEDFPSSSIGFNVSIPLTNSQARGHARAARLQRQQAETDLKRLEADIAMSVANAASQIETSRRRVVADRDAYQLANQALADEEKKLKVGSTTTNNVIQQQQILISDENSVASALAAQRQAAANYDHELGATLQRYTITLADNR
jgi:outer membrane protein